MGSFVHWRKPGPGRHIARVRIEASILLDLLRLDGSARVRFEGIPDDAVVLGFAIQDALFPGEIIDLYVESPSLPSSPPEQLAPELPVLTRTFADPMDGKYRDWIASGAKGFPEFLTGSWPSVPVTQEAEGGGTPH